MHASRHASEDHRADAERPPSGGPEVTAETRLSDVVDIGRPAAVMQEVRCVLDLLPDPVDTGLVEAIYRDVQRLFAGAYPGYQASNTRYHNLEHTSAVFLATARLIHGCSVAGRSLNGRQALLGVAAALFHDVGLIQQVGDRAASGAHYTVGHEERSIAFMAGYLGKRGFSRTGQRDCADIIRCTILDMPASSLTFRCRAIETLGHVLGSADLLGQMADRLYLEKLLLLFREFRDAGIGRFRSELDLLHQTADFYDAVARKRLREDFDGVSDVMRLHFKERWDIDQDLYEIAIANNMAYLRQVVARCHADHQAYLAMLRRGGIVASLRRGG